MTSLRSIEYMNSMRQARDAAAFAVAPETSEDVPLTPEPTDDGDEFWFWVAISIGFASLLLVGYRLLIVPKKLAAMEAGLDSAFLAALGKTQVRF